MFSYSLELSRCLVLWRSKLQRSDWSLHSLHVKWPHQECNDAWNQPFVALSVSIRAHAWTLFRRWCFVDVGVSHRLLALLLARAPHVAEVSIGPVVMVSFIWYIFGWCSRPTCRCVWMFLASYMFYSIQKNIEMTYMSYTIHCVFKAGISLFQKVI